ncbi:MAG: helix-turn-helix transcriptional regulator [Acidimicrobiales bacterium]
MPEAPEAPERSLTDFENVLLGWIAAGPQSAYDLKKLFSATPASVYQPSPGALVPALRRLERRGLVSVEPDSTEGRRPRRLYRLTESGRVRHHEWLRQPVDPATVGRDLGQHLVRFVMMERALPPAEVLDFLAELGHALEVFVDSIEQYVASTSLPGRHPLLALEHGLRVHRASLEWVRSAIAVLAATLGDPPAGLASARQARGVRA